MDKLKPCPFCGGKAELDPKYHVVGCALEYGSCDVIPQTWGCETDEEAIEAWNRRNWEQKTGKWIRRFETIEDENGIEYNPHCKCSECGTEYEPYFTRVVKYCYRCGARMEGEQDG